MPSATTPLGRKPGKAAEGEPRVRRPAARRSVTEPLAEGGFVSRLLLGLLVALLVVLVGASGSPAAVAPHRIVSLSPTATETLFAIGAGTQVIAVDSSSDYPKAAQA